MTEVQTSTLHDYSCKIVRILVKPFQCQSRPRQLHSRFCLLFKESLKHSSFVLSPSERGDRCRLIFFHIYLRSLWAWYDLCSPSHLIITLFPHSLFFTCLSFSSSFSLCPRWAPPLLTHLPSLLSSLQSSLSNGDKGRQADYLSNGKKRKADEKEFMTDYVRRFHKAVKCFSNWRKVLPNSSSPPHIKPVDCVELHFSDNNWNIHTPTVISVLLWKRDFITQDYYLEWDKSIVDCLALWLCSSLTSPSQTSKLLHFYCHYIHFKSSHLRQQNDKAFPLFVM